MSLFEAIILGIVQGLTEFLPISSTAHLRVVPALLGWKDPGAAFTAVIQLGTLVAVMIYFAKDVAKILRAMGNGIKRGKPLETHEAKLGWMVALGTVPVVAFGLLFKKSIETHLRSLYVISGALIGLALVLAFAEWLHRRYAKAGQTPRELETLGWWDAIVVGTAQAVALIPGSSRSGTTITAGLFLNMSRSTAARFSFLLSLPAIFAAAVLELYKERAVLFASRDDAAALIVATVVSGLVGYASIAFLIRYLRTHSTWGFIVYRLLLGALLLYLLSAGHLSPMTGIAE